MKYFHAISIGLLLSIAGFAAPDPNSIGFTVSVTNFYVKSAQVPAKIKVVGGVPWRLAVLVDDANREGATWTDYTTSNLTINLGTKAGWHEVWIGLRGQPADAQPTWQWEHLKLELTPPSVTISDPPEGVVTVRQPVIQIKGWSPVALRSITYDVSDARGVVKKGERGDVTDQAYSTETHEWTTNWFQCYDVPLEPGLNTITLHLTDEAGNTTTVSRDLALDYAGKAAPTVQVVWPQDGMAICGSSFSLHGQVNDPTVEVSVQIIGGGDTNTIHGLVDRDGIFWVEKLPLKAGTNTLTLTVVDAASNTVTRTMNLRQASGNVRVYRVMAGDTSVTVAADRGYTVWVNGVKATKNGDGTWTAPIKPIGVGGGAVEVEAIPDTDNGGNGINTNAPGGVSAQGLVD